MKTLLYSLIFTLALFLTGCADAGKNQTVDAGALVTLDASASTPSRGGEIKHYRWKQVGGKDVTLSNKRAIKPTFTAPERTKKFTLVFKLTTVEVGGHPYRIRSHDFVRITVLPKEDNARDDIAPVITLNGSVTLMLEQGATYTEEGATATDNIDGTVEVTTSGEVDTQNVGTYTVTYTATDTAGNVATKDRTITVVLPVDTEAPVITLNGDSNISLMQGEVYTELGASVTDNRDTNLTVEINGTVDTSIEGRYMITYNVSDAAGNVADKVTRIVTVIAKESRSMVSGHVTSTAGTEVLGISVNVLKNTELQNESTTTNDYGMFNIQLDANTEYTLTFTEDGFANQTRRIKTGGTGETLNLDITLISRGELQAIENISSVTLVGADGASVNLATTFVDKAGNIVIASDGVSLSVTPVDVSSPAGLAAFPGDFSGIQEGQTESTPIISYGAVEYRITRDSDGEVLQLRDGFPATIQIPIYTYKHQDGRNIALGDIIPLWSLNEETGIWIQEGTGIVKSSIDSPTKFVLEATVTHFTWWNCDVTMNPALATVTVNAPESGTALIKARTNTNIGWRPNTVDTVIAVGSSTQALPIPSNGEVCFWAEISFTSGNFATTRESCVSVNPGENININLLIEGGDLSLVATPNANITAYVNRAIQTVKIQPNTAETVVSYVINSGTLPTGLRLHAINSTTSTISGIPIESGTFDFDIKGTDSDGNEAIISIAYDISNNAPIYDIRFIRNPTNVTRGSDPGTFWFEILPFVIIDGVYENGVRIAGGTSVNCDRTTVDLGVPGVYQSRCSYGGSFSILTINVL